MTDMENGDCKLTKEVGKFVKSHIIPKSLTRPNISGNKFIEKKVTNHGPFYGKASDSWYDPNIVTQKGEDILAYLDTLAIEELRGLGLVWSSHLFKANSAKQQNSLRLVKFQRPKLIRKYFLSLLWRAAVTKISAFSEVNLNAKNIELLRQIIVGEKEDNRAIFPISLVQLSTKGHTVNLAPFKQKMDINGGENIYRFYHDGLVIHMYIDDPRLSVLKSSVDYNHPMFIGLDITIINQINYENSFQYQNTLKHTKEYFNHFPSQRPAKASKSTHK